MKASNIDLLLQIKTIVRSENTIPCSMCRISSIVLAVPVLALSSLLPAQTAAGSPNQNYGLANIAAPAHSTGQGNTTSSEPSGVVFYQPVPVHTMCDFGQGFSGGGASEARASLLDKSGPQLPLLFSMSAFSIMGFVKGNWPVVFDYLLEQDSLVIVIIAPEGMEPLIYRLNGKKGHWQSRLTISGRVGDDARVAQYVIRSLDENVGQIGSSHFHIHGIAAGPKAVGSIGIDQVTFSPAAIRPALGEKAHYMFHSISDFKRVDVDFVRVAVAKDGQIIAARVDGKSMGRISRNDQKNGDWDGKGKVDGKLLQSYPPQLQQWLSASRGQHLVQVRAWWGERDGDWATALSEDYVTVE